MLGYQIDLDHVSMRSGEMLRLRERYRSAPFALSSEMLRLCERYGDRDPLREREGLRETYREPVSEAGMLLERLLALV